MSTSGALPVCGGGGFGFGRFPGDEMKEVLQLLKEHGVKSIDSGRTYGNSEDRLGEFKAGEDFAIDSKTPGGLIKGESTEENIVKHAKESCQKLGVKQLNIFYLHTPDPTLNFHSQLRGINTAHRKGLFLHFGLSNFSAAQILDAHSYCSSQGFVLPTVYQGNYSAVARHQESAILPTCRALDIAFYAYSPMAGGFLAKTVAQIEAGGEQAGRVGAEGPMGKLYAGLYKQPAMLRGLELWGRAAEVAGCGRAELAYRWVVFDSALRGELGDAVVFGASGREQVRETLEWWRKGSVGVEARRIIEEVWRMVEGEAKLNNLDDRGEYVVKIV